MVSSGCASNCNSSEIATPMRARPKSRPKMGFIFLLWRHRRARRVQSSLQFRRKFTDQLLDPFRFMAVADQKRIRCADNDKIMHSEQCDCRSPFLKDDVVTGIDRSEGAIRRVSAFVLLKIIRQCAPASYVVPIKTSFDDKRSEERRVGKECRSRCGQYH